VRPPERDAITGLQRPTRKTADAADHVRRAAPEHERHVKSSVAGDVGPRSAATFAKPEHAARIARPRRVGRERASIEEGAQIRPGDGENGGPLEPHLRAEDRGFEHRGIDPIANQQIRETICPTIHRAGHGNASILVTPSPAVLDGGEETGLEDGDAA